MADINLSQIKRSSSLDSAKDQYEMIKQSSYYKLIERQVNNMRLPQVGGKIPLLLNGQFIELDKIQNKRIIGAINNTSPNSNTKMFDFRGRRNPRISLEKITDEKKPFYWDFQSTLLARIKYYSYCEENKIHIEIGKLKEFCKQKDIPLLSVRRNTIFNTVDIYSADYVVALKYPKEFCEMASVRISSGTTGVKLTEEYLKLLNSSTATANESAISQYYIDNCRLMKSRYLDAVVCRELKDLVPVAVNLDNRNSLFNRLTSGSIQVYGNVNKDIKDSLMKLIANSVIVNAPTLSMMDTNSQAQILYIVKSDLTELTDIAFNEYTLEMGAHVLNSLTNRAYSKIYEFYSASWIRQLKGLAQRETFRFNIVDETLRRVVP